MKRNTTLTNLSIPLARWLLIWLLIVSYISPIEAGNFNYAVAYFGTESNMPLEICDNGIDDDGDGFIDCADEDCNVATECPIPANCTVTEGNIVFNTINTNTAGEYTTVYILANASNVITEISNTTTFNGVVEGGYILYILNYTSSEGIAGVQIGAAIKNITGSCFEVSAGMALRVCKPEEICNNGIDDDGDGFIDCSDSDCDVMVNCPIPSNCTVTEGSIEFDAMDTNIGGDYSTVYMLANASNIIIQISNTTTFNGVVEGGYILYILNYTTVEGIAGVQIGAAIKDITGSCFEVSAGAAIKVCRNLDLSDDVFSSCPGLEVKNIIAINNGLSGASIIANPTHGIVTLQPNGGFVYTPSNAYCGVDSFSYEITVTDSGIKDTSKITIQYSDNIIPTLADVPENDTFSCDDIRLAIPRVTAIDNCPAISIDVNEVSTQGEDGCSLYDYTLTRTWTATDACGNSTDSTQVVEIEDLTAPDIFRIYTLPNGKKMVAGVMENVTHRWKTISLPFDFGSTPLIFSQVITKNETSPVTTRLQNISTQKFELRLQEEEGEDARHSRESVAWIAIEAGNQSTDFPLEARLLNLNDAWLTVNYQASYGLFPSFFASMQTTAEEDPATLRFQNPNLTSLELRIEEENSVNPANNHSNEQVAFLGIDHGINLTEETGSIFGETGSISVGSNWTTVHLTNKYYNPVVITGPPQALESDPGVISIRNVTADSFDIKFQEWNYLDGIHTPEFVAYLVVEGSLPLDATMMCETGTDGLELGKDIVALDNCDVSVTLQYKDSTYFEGANKIINRNWSAVDECGNKTSLTQDVICRGVAVQLKSFLQGAMIGSNEPGLMRDDLRRKGIIPLTEPYTDLLAFQHVGEGGGETAEASLFAITGPKAVVDWVFIELRSPNNQEEIVATCAGLIQRDGNIISAKGDTTIAFYNVPPNDYYIAIQHRNHLGTQSLNTYPLNNFEVQALDFSYTFMPTRGRHPLTMENGYNSIWAGDLNRDNKVIYQGPQNEIFYIFLQVLLDDNNTNGLSNFINAEYSTNDFNLDGVTIYQGPNNDRAMLLYNTTLKHPDNPSNLPNFVISIKDD